MPNRICIYLISLVLLLVGCSDPAEEKKREAFRKELVDKAVNDETRLLGEAFLKENATQEGVIVTDTGLQYRILKTGDYTVSPTFNEAVVVHFQGRRVDGVVFDDTAVKNIPSTFPIKRVIRGWQQALTKMHVGDRWELYIPAELAYGATSPSEAIPANSALIFTVELLEIKAIDEQEIKGPSNE